LSLSKRFFKRDEQTFMASFNKVILLGNLTRDPEMRMTPSGQAVCKFSMAVNRTYTGQDGQKKEEVTFVDVDSFGKQAETIGKYCTRGKQLFVEGRLKLDSWEKNGEKRSKLTVVLENFQFVGDRASGGDAPSGPDAGDGQDSPPARPAPRPSAPRAPAPPPRNDFADDDQVPF